jgi:hypothetical protein
MEQEVNGVEVDGTFGRLVGLREGMKVCFCPDCFWFLVLWFGCCGDVANWMEWVGFCFVAY